MSVTHTHTPPVENKQRGCGVMSEPGSCRVTLAMVLGDASTSASASDTHAALPKRRGWQPCTRPRMFTAWKTRGGKRAALEPLLRSRTARSSAHTYAT